jgi:hypothetical protein
MGMNQGNWGAFLQAVPEGVETEQKIQGKAYENQQAANTTDKSNMSATAARDEFDADTQKHNLDAAKNNSNPNPTGPTGETSNNQQMGYQNYAQQSGGVFDPARNAIHAALANIGQFYQKHFTLPTAGKGPAPAAQANSNAGPGAPGTQAPAAMSPPGPTSTGPSTPGTPGASGPMPQNNNPNDPNRYAEGGAIPGRKLQGIRAKKGKPGNVAKATAGDKQVANQQPGAGGPPMAMQASAPPRNTEPNPSNQDPQLADGGKPPAAEELGEPKKKGKAAKREELGETVNKFKDGGKVPFPKLEPGAAPAPKPAPNSLEQTVNNDGMRHYLGKTIKRFADGGKPDPVVPTPAGAQPADTQPKAPLGDPKEPSLFDRAVTGVKNFASDPSDKSLAERAGLSGGTNPAPPGMQGPSAQPAPEPAPTPVPSRAAGPAQPNYTPAAPGGVPDAKTPQTQQVVSPYDENIRGPQLPGDIASAANTGKAAASAGAGGAPDGQPPAPHTAQQGPAAPEQVDFSKVKADQSQVPTMSTQDWAMMHDSIRHVAVANGMSGGQAEIAAEEEVSKYQHSNFLQYMQQAQALDAAGNKEGAMAALKTGYQFFPTGHDMHFGLGPNGDILGYGVNEKTGQPVQNGLIHLNAQNLAGIISHFTDPKAFVEEGLRMQHQANEDAKTPAEIGLMHERGKYLGSIVPGRIATQELKNEGAAQKAQFSSQDHEQRFQNEFKDLPNHGEALSAAAQMEQLYTQRFGRPPDEAARMQIGGEVRTKLDATQTSPEERAQWEKQRGISYNQGPAPTPVPNRDDYARTSNALSG